MAMSWYDNSHRLNTHDLEYLKKVEYLWNHISQQQRLAISSSVTRDTLRQENSEHCLIGEAIWVKKKNMAPRNNSFVCMALEFIKIIFYDGPSYDNLLDRRVTREEKKILNDIYYAKIGNKEHQYRKANELVKFHIIKHSTI
ncbi:MAG: hypothetical protein ACRDFB_01970 [Rhabdochlamydiaceae bacterium]